MDEDFEEHLRQYCRWIDEEKQRKRQQALAFRKFVPQLMSSLLVFLGLRTIDIRNKNNSGGRVLNKHTVKMRARLATV